MIISMRLGATKEEVEHVCERIAEFGGIEAGGDLVHDPIMPRTGMDFEGGGAVSRGDTFPFP